MRRDWIEAVANAVAGFAISAVAVQALRWAGAWDANPLAIGAVFFALSVARSWALRAWFRGRE